MNKKRLKHIKRMSVVILCTVFFMTSGCKNSLLKNNDEEQISSDNGQLLSGKEPTAQLDATHLAGTKWKLVGIVDTKTGELKKLNPVDCEACYTLAFDTDFTLSAITISSRSKLDLRNLNPPEVFNKILTCERYDKDGNDYCDSDKFWRSLLATESWSTMDEELKLFTYGGYSYLLFTPHNGDNPTTSIRGTRWKLTGITDAQTGDLKELEPKDCADCYMLDFLGDYIIGIRSLRVTTSFDLLKLERVDNPPPSGWPQGYVPVDTWTSEYDINNEIHDVKDKEDSNIFRYSIDNIKSYEITADELKLFFVYNEKDSYLTFKLIYQ